MWWFFACTTEEAEKPAIEEKVEHTPTKTADGHVPGAPHGNHDPHHGGKVGMDGEYHLELVMQPDGTYQIWMSDAVRVALPADKFAGALAVTPKDGAAAIIPLQPDPGGFLVGKGQPLSEGQVKATVSGADRPLVSYFNIP